MGVDMFVEERNFLNGKIDSLELQKTQLQSRYDLLDKDFDAIRHKYSSLMQKSIQLKKDLDE